MNNQNRALSILISGVRKIIILLFFLGGLFSFLYLPRILNFYTEDDIINLYMFTEFVSPEAIREFEKQEGIKVHVQYYESNEELYAKFKISGGVGYDLIAPSDYMVELLRKDGLLQKLDLTKITRFCELDPFLLDHDFDPGNKYSLPITWSVYGIIYDKSLLKPGETINYDYIFRDPDILTQEGLVKKPYKICMFDDPREVFLIASHYLLNKITNLSLKDWERVSDLLVNQKKWVECYTNFGLSYFLEGSIISCAVTSSRYVPRMIESRSDNFGFVIPSSGSMYVIENFAIPVHSKKSDKVHKFIDFMLSRDCNTYHFNQYGGSPVNIFSYKDLDSKYFNELPLFPDKKLFKNLFLVHNHLPLREIEEMWLRVKTS